MTPRCTCAPAKHLASSLDLLDRLAWASGLRVNRAKSHGIWLAGGCAATEYCGIPFLADRETTRYLGVRVGRGSLTRANWLYRDRQLRTRLGFAERCRLMLSDRATVLRTIALPAILFTAAFFYPSDAQVAALQLLFLTYLWSGRVTPDQPKRSSPIAKEILALPLAEGGLAVPMVQTAVQEQALKAEVYAAVADPDANRLMRDLLTPGPTAIVDGFHLHRDRSPAIQLRSRRLPLRPGAEKTACTEGATLLNLEHADD